MDKFDEIWATTEEINREGVDKLYAGVWFVLGAKAELELLVEYIKEGKCQN